MKKIIPLIVAGLLTLGIAKSYAQDFFSGFSSPKELILNTFVNTNKEGTSTLFVPAYFPKVGDEKLPSLLIAPFIDLSNGKVKPKGGKLGYVNQNGDNNSTIYSISATTNNDYTAEISHTTLINDFCLDGQISTTLQKNEKPKYFSAITTGYNVLPNNKNLNLRLGGSAYKKSGENIALEGRISLELLDNKKPKCWMEYNQGKDYNGFRFVYTMGRKK